MAEKEKPKVCQNCVWRSRPICRKTGEFVARKKPACDDFKGKGE